MSYFDGRVKGGGLGWGWRSGTRVSGFEAVVRAPQGRIEMRMTNRNGVDWVRIERIVPGKPVDVVYDGPVAGPDAVMTHGRPVRYGHHEAVRSSLGIEEYKVGCGNCAHASNGWGSGCAVNATANTCGGWRWPRYGSIQSYPHWKPRLPEGQENG